MQSPDFKYLTIRHTTPDSEVRPIRARLDPRYWRVSQYGDFALTIFPIVTEASRLRWRVLKDIDGTRRDSTGQLNRMVREKMPGAGLNLINRWYDTARIWVTESRTIFDPTVLSILLSRYDPKKTPEYNISRSRKVIRQARALGILAYPADVVPVTTPPRAYRETDLVMRAVCDVTGVAPVAFTSGAYGPQFRKIEADLNAGLLSGAVITKGRKMHAMARLVRHPGHPIMRDLFSRNGQPIEHVAMIGEELVDVEGVLGVLGRTGRTTRGFILDNPGSYYSEQQRFLTAFPPGIIQVSFRKKTYTPERMTRVIAHHIGELI